MKKLTIETKTLEISKLLNGLIGDVTARHLFTGYGIFYQKEIMFGIYFDGVFYLKADKEFGLSLKNLGAKPFISNNSGVSHYYQLPDNITEDKHTLKELIMQAISHINQSKLYSIADKNMKNFN